MARCRHRHEGTSDWKLTAWIRQVVRLDQPLHLGHAHPGCGELRGIELNVGLALAATRKVGGRNTGNASKTWHELTLSERCELRQRCSALWGQGGDDDRRRVDVEVAHHWSNA